MALRAGSVASSRLRLREFAPPPRPTLKMRTRALAEIEYARLTTEFVFRLKQSFFDFMEDEGIYLDRMKLRKLLE